MVRSTKTSFHWEKVLQEVKESSLLEALGDALKEQSDPLNIHGPIPGRISMGALPFASNLFMIAYTSWFGQALYVFILIGTLAGLVTTWNGFFVAAPCLMMALARANLLPKFMAKQNPKTGVPTNSVWICCVISLLGPVAGLGLIDPLTSFSGTACLTSWVITCYCLLQLRRKEPDLPRPYRIT